MKEPCFKSKNFVCLCPECRKDTTVSESPSVTGYVPSFDEIKAYTPLQARGFIVGSLTVKFNLLGISPEQACEMANIILEKADT
jgi:hypothetical protein